jgi:hypothetical protein
MCYEKYEKAMIQQRKAKKQRVIETIPVK